MQRISRFLGAVAFVAAIVPLRAQTPAAQQGTALAPVANAQPYVTHIHGYTRTDNYFWLREKSNPAVRAYLEAENAYTDAAMKPTEALQHQLYDEMLRRIKQTDESAPYPENGFLYYSRTEEGKEYPILCRKRAGSDVEQVLVDENEMAKGLGFFSVGTATVSNDGNLLAFTTDTTGYRQYTLHIKDLRSGQFLPDRIVRVGSVVWSTDDHTLFVTTEDSVTKRSDNFWRHTVGSNDTKLVYHEPDELFDVFGLRSEDRTTVILISFAKTMTEARYVRADHPLASLTLLLPREPGHEYYPDFDDGKLLIRTNKGAKNFRLVSAPIKAPTQWKEVVPHDPHVKLDDFTPFRNFLVLSEREDGLPYLRIIDKKTGASHRVATPEPAYLISLGNNHEYDAKRIQFFYTSLVTPASTFDYDVRTRERKLLKQQPVFGYDPVNYESRRLWATARDGTKVPVAIVYKKGTSVDGTAPLLLYAYGSYGASIDPSFTSNRVSLLDRGFIYALASIRGGGELGEEWREAGRMMKKMNTFTDFIDVAQYLVDNKYTSTDRLMIQGASAGGLLMGAVTNMRPDLFKAVNAGVPFVDVMNTMLDASLPLTTSEYIEWGNPNEKPAYDYMMQYSPYDNVKAQRYPAMLVEVSFNDSQVPYWEGTKLVAKLRATKTDSNALLLKANLGAGHGGSSGRYDRLKEIAFEYAFFLNQLPDSKRVVP
ncbi:MAG TPA: S9 family peptidase [Gemmatimonadaceae bacterium]|jgi:oligopeptidase B